MDFQGMRGTHISQLTCFMEFESVPLNWLLFRTTRETVPQPQHQLVSMLDMTSLIPPETGMALAASKTAQMLSVLSMPSLLMWETCNRQFSLGSGWAFVGGGPGFAGPGRGRSYKKIRFMNYLTIKKTAVSVLTSEVYPGVLAFSMVAEIDERSNESTWGLIDATTEEVHYINTHYDRRYCVLCSVNGMDCVPETCANQENFLGLRSLRTSLAEADGFVGLQYMMAWLQGTWTIPLGVLEPILVDMAYYPSGERYSSALGFVLQEEVATIHPPRSSYRLCKLAQDQCEQILEIKDQKDAQEVSGLPSSVRGPKFLRVGSVPDKVEPAVETSSKHGACEFCGMTFKRKYDLRRHRASVHLKRRDFKCQYCAKTFTQNGHLHEHIRLNHETESTYQCPECDKKFGAKSKLDRHVRTVHDNVRNFQCHFCQKKYKERSYLKHHLLARHGVSG
eukprot:CAMPEP_0113959726 /NCGR_PEP_ID=MMETSP0011_2-20120614/4310_1 /TAXON_ID=101924 /ORGANISM="Rhodosorus marinus" /LENGTH=448 /DNA_ID=CAMNT_0000971081 /DNA_START=95 /DNA_END=1441 /DNA_ORIENTATION=- /assembly_acc=CAM_ASM_000156